MSFRAIGSVSCLCLLVFSGTSWAESIILEKFSGYPDDALISTSPAGPALGLTGDWQLDSESDFYVNRTQLDKSAGDDCAVYDRPSDDNGSREASRLTSSNHIIFSKDGDEVFASFNVIPGRSGGHMTFELRLNQLNGGGQRDLAFGMINGRFIVGNGGVDVDVSGGKVLLERMNIVLRVEYGDMNTGPDNAEVVTLWVNPANLSSTPVIDQVPVDLLNRGGARISAVSIRGEHMAGQPAFFDDLRVGSDFEEISRTAVVPTLSPWGLLTLLLIVMTIGAISIKRKILVKYQHPEQD